MREIVPVPRHFTSKKAALFGGSALQAVALAMLLLALGPGSAAAVTAGDLGHSPTALLPAVVFSENDATRPAAVQAVYDFARGNLSHESFFLTQLAQQGVLPWDAVAPPSPRGSVYERQAYRMPYPTCDLDGDGVNDLMVNMVIPTLEGTEFGIAAISGANGTEIWSMPNAYLGNPRGGEGFPNPLQPAQPTGDHDGDGVCDLFVMGLGDYHYDRFGTVVAEHMEIKGSSHARLVSGKSGEEIWITTFPETLSRSFVAIPGVSLQQHVNVTGRLNGFVMYETQAGPRVAVKLLDFSFTEFRETPQYVCVTCLNPLGDGQPDVYVHLTTRETVVLLDGSTGEILWNWTTGELVPDAAYARFSWFSGVTDLNGDNHPDLVLDQYIEQQPRGVEAYDNVFGATLTRLGRGMALYALDGSPEGAEDPLWYTMIKDPDVTLNLKEEENYETLILTRGTVLGDVDGDGVSDAVAQYLVMEEGRGSAAYGTVYDIYRTHFALVSGKDGAKAWNIRQQGWGFPTSMETNGSSVPLVGLGMIDLVDHHNIQATNFRLVVLSAEDGGTVWSYERPFPKSHLLSMNLAQLQFEEALAPMDYDGDGIRELMTPGMYVTPTGRTQVLLSTFAHSYEILRGVDGTTLQTLYVWGPQGRLLECGDEANGLLTFAGGHSRRIDFTRIDPHKPNDRTRHVIYNDPVPRAATVSTDLLSFGAHCAPLDEKRIGLASNIRVTALFFPNRLYTALGVVNASANETTLWVNPPFADPVPGDTMFHAAYYQPPDPPAVMPFLVGGGLLGIIGGVATLRVGSRVGPFRSAFGALMILGVLAPTLLLPAAAGLVQAPSLGIQETTGSIPDVGTTRLPEVSAQLPLTLSKEDQSSMSPMSEALLLQEFAALVAQGAEAHDILSWANRYLDASLGGPKGGSVTVFDHNNTVFFSYPLDDVNGDGVGDVLMDQYCVDRMTCRNFRGETPTNRADRALGGGPCSGYPHRILAVSGADGTILWGEDVSCANTYIIDVLPTERGRAVLTYNVSVGYPAPGYMEFFHVFRLMDPATWEEIWTHQEKGYMIAHSVVTPPSQPIQPNYAMVMKSENVAMKAIPQIPATRGLRIDPEGMQPTLHLHGTGVNATYLAVGNPAVSGNPIDGDGPMIPILQHSEPNDRITHLDIETGEVLWKKKVLQPVEDRGLIVRMVSANYHRQDDFRGVPPSVEDQYWRRHICCSDLTGDGVADLIYLIEEYPARPVADDQEFYRASRIVAVDGSKGEILWDKYLQDRIETDLIQRQTGQLSNLNIYRVDVEMIGDATGDGLADVLVHERFLQAEYHERLALLDGADGALRWERIDPHNLAVLVLGDANKDGGNDFLVFKYFGAEGSKIQIDDTYSDPKYDQYAIPSAVPLIAYSGADGSRLWEIVTYIAPVDLDFMLAELKYSGLPDVNGDGVADVPVDNPEILDDLTVIHHIGIHSGSDAALIHAVTVTGDFAFPFLIGDLDGDGRDEFGFIGGDAADLWFGAYNGATGDGMWSRRLQAPQVSGYVLAQPYLRTAFLDAEDPTNASVLLTFHFDSIHVGGAMGLPDGFHAFEVLKPQMIHVRTLNGSLNWALPDYGDPSLFTGVQGVLPAVPIYDKAVDLAYATRASDALAEIPYYAPAGAAFGVSYLVTIGVGLVVARVRRIDAEVPNLD